MNSCLWFFGLVEFFGQGFLKFPPERSRINTGQSGGSGDGSPPVGSRGKTPVGGLGNEVPPQKKLKLFAHILKNGIGYACLDI